MKGSEEEKADNADRRGKRIAIVMAVVLVLFACSCCSGVVRPFAAGAIEDKENDKKVDVSSLLNSGTRIDDDVYVRGRRS